ncbi:MULTISPECIES: FecR family protein [unclassified Chitinophaga]|uniref:FecR family protein n=1 Tax=unclassified Chitinophaga TaxID=2619133 RepID=UPI00300F959E
MDLNEKKIRELLGQYLDGTLSPAESAQVEAWYSSYDTNQHTPPAFSTKKEEEDAHRAILKGIHDQLKSQPQKTRIRKIGNKIKIAAAVSFVLISAGLTFFVNRSGSKQQLSAVTDTAAMNTIEVAEGKMKLVELSDGTKIWLNAATKFSYPKQFSDKTREVTLLEGEAFFDVAHETNRPFIVHSKGLSTQVLGTSFNIDAYNFSKCVKISVATGKVGVNHGKEVIGFLTPNEEIQYKLLLNKSIKTTRDGSAVSSWRSGAIMLDYVDFESLKAILFNNYNYVLKTGKRDLSHLHFSATIKKTDRIEDVMKLLSSINQTKFSIIDKTIVMY